MRNYLNTIGLTPINSIQSLIFNSMITNVNLKVLFYSVDADMFSYRPTVSVLFSFSIIIFVNSNIDCTQLPGMQTSNGRRF